MKINILFPFVDGPYGGGNQFLKALKKEFERKGRYEEDSYRADAVIFNSFPFEERFKILWRLIRLKWAGKKIIHRVDGPISTYRDSNPAVDQRIFRLNHWLADATVFQSEYSRKANIELGFKAKGIDTIIINAPDPEIFNQAGREPFVDNRKMRLVAVSWSTHPNKGFEAYRWLDENLDFTQYEMSFAGRSPVRFKHIRELGALKSSDLSCELKKHDVFVSASRFECCSNALLEAMHCGLVPVVIRSGCHAELVGDQDLLFNKQEEIPDILSGLRMKLVSYSQIRHLKNMDGVAGEYFKLAHLLCPEK